VGTGSFLIRHSKGQINKSPIKEIQRLFLTKYWSLNLKKLINFKVAITEMYQRIPWDPWNTLWEPLADSD
jgi:hypothetical protein